MSETIEQTHIYPEGKQERRHVAIPLWILLLLVALLFSSLGLLAGNLIWKDNQVSKRTTHCLIYPHTSCYDYPRIMPYSSSQGLDKSTEPNQSPPVMPNQGNSTDLPETTDTPGLRRPDATNPPDNQPNRNPNSSLFDKLKDNN